MQVISRRVNEGLVIDNEIFVTVLDIYDDHVRLAISSPRNSPSYWEQSLYLDPQEQEASLEFSLGSCE